MTVQRIDSRRHDCCQGGWCLSQSPPPPQPPQPKPPPPMPVAPTHRPSQSSRSGADGYLPGSGPTHPPARHASRRRSIRRLEARSIRITSQIIPAIPAMNATATTPTRMIVTTHPLAWADTANATPDCPRRIAIGPLPWVPPRGAGGGLAQGAPGGGAPLPAPHRHRGFDADRHRVCYALSGHGRGSLLPMTDVIRLATHAHHYLVIYDKCNQIPLYLARTKRFASAGQRIVLHDRDRGCTSPDVPSRLRLPGASCRTGLGQGRADGDHRRDVGMQTAQSSRRRGWLAHAKRKDGTTERIPPRRFNFRGVASHYQCRSATPTRKSAPGIPRIRGHRLS